MEPTCPANSALVAVHEKEFKHLRELLEEKLKATDKALTVQAIEYQRRLTELNHAAERLSAMQERFVNADLYRAEHKALADLHRADLERLEREVQLIQKMVWVGVGILAAVQFGLHYIR